MSFTPPPGTNCHTFSDPFPLERDILPGRPLGRRQPMTGRGGAEIVVICSSWGWSEQVVEWLKLWGCFYGDGEEGRGRGWVVVKARATAGNPVSVWWKRIVKTLTYCDVSWSTPCHICHNFQALLGTWHTLWTPHVIQSFTKRYRLCSLYKSDHINYEPRKI